MEKIALTGIKPSGTPHIGNLLGAIQPALDLTKNHYALYFIADYHALTSVKDKKLLHNQTYQLAATWLAAGLDPKKVIFYRQSNIPEIFELAWILSCVASKGLLNRAHSYKGAIDLNNEEGKDIDFGINCGLYNYPILMAADILMFGTNVVPVGQDQKQHLEITRDIAQSFNQTFDDILTLPDPLIRENVKTIPGIDGRKMSKSYNNVIPLYSTTKLLKQRINQIVTDSKGVDEPKDPDKCNIFSIYKLFADKEEISKTEKKYRNGGLGYGDMKKELYHKINSFVADGRERYNSYMENKAQIDHILQEGAKKARSIATPLLKKVKKAIGV